MRYVNRSQEAVATDFSYEASTFSVLKLPACFAGMVNVSELKYIEISELVV